MKIIEIEPVTINTQFIISNIEYLLYKISDEDLGPELLPGLEVLCRQYLTDSIEYKIISSIISEINKEWFEDADNNIG